MQEHEVERHEEAAAAGTVPPAAAWPSAWREALEDVRRTARLRLEPRIQQLFEQAELGLIDLAARTEDEAAQERIFTGMAALLGRRDAWLRLCLEAIDQGFDAFAAAAGDGAVQGTALANGMAAHGVPARNLVTRTVERYRASLHGIRTRLAVMHGGRPIRDEEIPAGPVQLVGLWQRLLAELPLTRRLSMVLYVLYDRHVLRTLTGFYDEYERRLAQAGLLPHLRPGGAAGGEGAPQAAVPPSLDRLQAPELAPSERHALLSTLLARSEAPELPVAVAAPPAVAGAPAPAASEVLSPTGDELFAGEAEEGLQGVVDRVRREGPATAAGTGEAPQAILAAERGALCAALVDAGRPLAGVDAALLGLADRLFDCLCEDATLDPEARGILARLYLPYLQAILDEVSLLAREEHPAHRLLNLLVAAARRWGARQAQEGNLAPLLNEAVQRLRSEERLLPTVFEEVFEGIASRVRELEYRSAAVAQRTLEALEGQRRLEIARHTARAHLARLLEGSRPPSGSEYFFTRIWADAFTLILLREAEGERSNPWQQATRVLKGILWTLEPREADEAAHEDREAVNTLIAAGLRDLSRYGLRDFEGWFDRIRAWQEALAQEPGVPRVASQDLVALLEEDEAESQPREDAEACLPGEAGARIGVLQPGALVEITREEGTRRRCLLHVDPAGGGYQFADVLGTRAEAFRPAALAAALEAGRVRILSRDGRLPAFLDHALVRLHGEGAGKEVLQEGEDAG